MKKGIKLTIVIVNYKTYPYLASCLNSLIQSNLSSTLYEIFIVDNASGDDSVSRIQKRYSYVHLIQNKKNEGFARANNRAIKRSHGMFVLTLNPDTILEKNTLSEMVSFMEKNPQIAIATCKVNLPTGELDDASHRGFPTPWNALCQFTGVSRLFPHNTILNGYHLGYQHIEKVHEIDACAGAFMLIRKTVGERVRWFDEDYFWYGEDIDFCYRVKKKGGKIAFVPYTTILHYKGIASGIKSHSQRLSHASIHTKRLATLARFEVMRIFYKKHYERLYPGWLTRLILLGIAIKEQITLLRLRS